MTSQGSTPTVVVELEKHPTLPMTECRLGWLMRPGVRTSAAQSRDEAYPGHC